MALTSALQVFLAGTAGGVLLEFLHWYGLGREGTFPDYARRPFYWIISAGMALAGGILAWIYLGSRAEGVLALHIGLSTPLILQKLATTAAQTPGGKGSGPGLLNFFRW